MDSDSRAWVDGLRARGGQRQAAHARLRTLLLRVADREVERRRSSLPFAWAELDGIARDAAAGALTAIEATLSDYGARSRFTTWASKFVTSEVSAKVGLRLWRTTTTVARYQEAWERPPRYLRLTARESAEWSEVAPALRRAVEVELSGQQRTVFTAVALNAVPADALAAELATNRNAVYKALFEARRVLRARLGVDRSSSEHPLSGAEPGPRWLDELLRADPGDAGCDVAFQVLDRYVDAQLREPGPGQRFPGLAAHLHGCVACRQDYDGLVAAARR